MSKLSVRNLYKIFGRKPKDVLEKVRNGLGKEETLAKTGHTVGLNDISLDIEEDETFVVMGLSGSGKSTMIRCLNRLIEPTAGEILIDGVDIVNLKKHEMQALRREKMGMVFQHFALLPHRTVIENVAYGLKLQKVDRSKRREIARHWTEVVGLKGYEEARPNELSGGMQQRVGLARALATDPEILLMDEAFSALDPLIRTEMQDELMRLQAELRKTIVFITHDLDEALRLGDRVAILKDGQLVQLGTPEEILTSPADDYVEAFVKNVDRSKVLTAGSVAVDIPTVGIETAPDALLKELAPVYSGTAYVTGPAGRYLGVVTAAELRQGVRRGDKDLREVVGESAPTVDTTDTLSKLFSVAAASETPIVVVDSEDYFQGVLTYRQVLEALDNSDTQVASTATRAEPRQAELAQS